MNVKYNRVIVWTPASKIAQPSRIVVLEAMKSLINSMRQHRKTKRWEFIEPWENQYSRFSISLKSL